MVPATVRRGIWAGLALAVIVGAAVYLVLRVPDAGWGEAVAEEEHETAEAERTRVAAMKRIAAESAGTIDPPHADAPDVAASQPPGAAPAPVAPEGYAFATFHEMTSRPLAPTPAVDEETDDPAADWLGAGDAQQRLVAQAAAAGRDWAFGWVRHAADANQAEVQRGLERLGGRVLGTAGNLLRVRLPGDLGRLGEIERLPLVYGVGATPPTLKTPAQFAREAAERPPDGRVPVFVTLMADDQDRRWRRALEDMGAEVGWFDADTRAYAANIPYGSLVALTAADFVLAVEPVGSVKAALATAVPAIGVDTLRTHNAATGLFSGVGGASVPVAVMDSGLNINHLDIASRRRSVCGANFAEGRQPREEDQDLWTDHLGHGTHVTGIFVGNGTVVPRRAGMAPLAQDIRFARVLDVEGQGTAVAWSRAQDWLSRPTACGAHPPVKPLVLNSSIGAGAPLWAARTTLERKLDAVVWRARQLYTIAAGNLATRGYVNYAGAKNVLSVGAVRNDGKIGNFSSRGPTADGRLFPHLVGPGVEIAAPRGRGSEREYVVNSGTSMAAPAVAGVAALVMDAVPALREKPAAVRSLLMASAVKPDAFFERRDVPWLVIAGRGRYRLDNGDGPGALQNAYGLGKASARTSVLSRDAEDGWVSGAAEAEVAADSFAYQDIVVPPGAKRLDVVLTWNEPAAETINAAVLNDLDLWIDRGVTCPPDQGACGDRVSRSRLDNVEWVILPNPPPGTYRLKAVPRRVYGRAPRAGLAWTIIRGPSTPQLAVAADRPLVATTPNQPFNVDLTLSVDGYVATGTTLRVDCRAPRASNACQMAEFIVPHASSATREDGLSRPLGGESGAEIVIGELGAGEQQQVSLRFKARPEAGNFRLHFTARAWNGVSASTSVEVRVGEADDVAPPPAERPPNDDFANAVRLTGARGRAAPVHILLATEEPGEPALRDEESEGRPWTVWYRWNAPSTGLARFTIAQEHLNDLSDAVALSLYRGDRIVSLQALALPTLGGGMSFFAEAGTDYVIRLDFDGNVIINPAPGGPVRYDTPPVVLLWAPGGTPVNDNFSDAVVLGDETVTAGNNQGATLEAGELVGQDFPVDSYGQRGISASVWYRWTAPATADWRFEVDRRHLQTLAFVGDDVASTRLVSGAAGRYATFPARAGQEYRIAVATENALYGGTDYRLAWAPATRHGSPHDDFANAEPIVELPQLARFDLNNGTVEPGEPPETGARTAWWSWQAEADGAFTWQASTNYLQLLVYSVYGQIIQVEAPIPFAMRFAAFTGDSLAALTPVAASGADTTALSEFTIEATAGQRYWFSIGLPREAALAPVGGELIVQLGAGPTPQNDSLAQAIALEGVGGTTSGSNQFATVEPDEKTGVYGGSSLWWTWQPPEAGVWYRFFLEQGAGVITVYKRMGAGFDGLELVMVSNGSVGKHEAVFQAEEDARYVIKLGATFDNEGGQFGERGDFEMRWEVNGTPVWLRYAGRVIAGMLSDDGVPLQLDSVIGGAVSGDGTLYANTVTGLRVFQRNPDTGALTLTQALAPAGPTPATLFWDEASRSLVTGSCEGWHRFRHDADSNGTPMLEYAGALAGDAPCADSWFEYENHTGTARLASPSPDGRAVDVVQRQAIDTYALDIEAGTLAFVDTLDLSVQGIAAHGDGMHVYAVDFGELHVLRRDAESGTLSLALTLRDGDGGGASGAVIEGLVSSRALVLDQRDQHLFVLSERGVRTLVFDLRDDPAQPRFLGGVLVQSGGTAPQVNHPIDECYSAQARDTTAAVDVFCGAYIYTVAVQPDGTPRQTDLLGPEQTDRFGRVVWPYDSSCLEGCVSTPASSLQIGLASPDGKHLYAIYARPEMAIFERVGGL